MSMTDVMDEIDYDTVNFNINDAEYNHPLWMTEDHFVYHLYRDDVGHLNCNRDKCGEPICSPRHLLDMCMNQLVRNPGNLVKHVRNQTMPSTLYPAMLSEAIFQRELPTINYLVSTWPSPVLDLKTAMPREDLIEQNILTTPVEEKDNLTILDCVIYGILGLKPTSKLKVVSFSGFKQDRKLCRELARLPLLWMKPEDRNVEDLYEKLTRTIDISKEKVQKYINRINCIYSNMDPHIQHGNAFDPITIVLDCKITLDDVPIGLGLQNETPFRFACQRVWMEPITDMTIPFNEINRVLEIRDLTQLEFQDPHVCTDPDQLDLLLNGLTLLPNMKSLSLPNTIHFDRDPHAVSKFSKTLRHLPALQKLNLSCCNLREHLGVLLSNLSQQITYLNLRDCRLTQTDLEDLHRWSMVTGLRELNISRNNFKMSHAAIIELLNFTPDLTCFSISYCSLMMGHQQQIVQKCMELKTVKILGIQSFTPPPMGDIEVLLQHCSYMLSLQKCFVLPDAFAFPGSNSLDRFENREHALELCETYLQQLGRSDIELE